MNSVWDIQENLKYDDPLKPDDDRIVPTFKGRGDVNYNRIYRPLGYDEKTQTLKTEPLKTYSLFCGHTGSGKSTELRIIQSELDHPDRFFVVFVDALRELDINNFSYPDLLMALSAKLFEKLNDSQVSIDKVFLRKLADWFDERIEKHENTKEYAAEIKSGIEGQLSIPFITKIFSKITASFKTNSTYKDELRKNIKNSFSEFAEIFNTFIKAAEDELPQKKMGKKILFVIDGTDRLSPVDGQLFFDSNVNQLQMIESNFIFGAPIGLVYSIGNQIHDHYNVFTLPMVKISEKSGVKIDISYKIMRDLILKRVPEEFFDSMDTVNYLVECSGGNPRHLIRLTNYTFQNMEEEILDLMSAKKAVKEMAVEMSKTLEAKDFKLLSQIDDADDISDFHSEQTTRLLYKLALLEYNSYWWMSHPVLRTLPAYAKQKR
jgi:hypothetical protein